MKSKKKNSLINYVFLTLLMAFSIVSCSKQEAEPNVFKLTSPAVSNGLLLDAFKCETKVNGTENSIPLSWSNAPVGTNAFAITMIHYPNPNNLVNYNSYLELWGIDKSVISIDYGKADDGPWFMGPNKDLNAISYTSPCSQGSGTQRYTITIYALSSTPASLPTQSSMLVTNQVLINSLSSVNIIGKATLVFDSVTP